MLPAWDGEGVKWVKRRLLIKRVGMSRLIGFEKIRYSELSQTPHLYVYCAAPAENDAVWGIESLDMFREKQKRHARACKQSNRVLVCMPGLFRSRGISGSK